MERTSQLKVVILDDNRNHLIIYRDSLRSRFLVSDILLHGQSVSEILNEVEQHHPDAVVLDVFRNRVNGDWQERTFISLLASLRERFRGRIPLIALTGRPKDTHVDLVLEWFRHGIADWVWKDERNAATLVNNVQLAIERFRSLRHRPIKSRVFVVHGGQSPEDLLALSKIGKHLAACGVDSVIAENAATKGLVSVNEHVLGQISGCDCAIVLATKDRLGPDPTKPRGNILHEFGVCQAELGRRVILLLEDGCELPSNVREFVRGRFSPACMEDAFSDVTRELLALDLL